MENKINLRFSIIAGLILLAAFSRMIPHTLNLSPLGAIGLFGAAYFTKKWQAFFIPLAATWLSDLYINNVIYGQSNPTFVWFYKGFYWQYGSYVVIILAALFIFKKVNTSRVLAGVLTSTVIFFLISNFGCWIGNPAYPQNLSGLMACYEAAIPFVKGTLFGDAFYSAVLFGSFAMAQVKFPVLKLAAQA